MRKSFILSLVMVVVLIASLATATFAWYTAQLSVNTNDITIATATTDKNMVIDESFIGTVTGGQKSVELAMNTGLQPMILGAEPTTSTKANLTFVTYTIDGGKVGGYNANATASRVTTVDSESQAHFFVANTGTGSYNYKVTVDIASDAANSGLRVAIFVNQGVNSSYAYDATGLSLVGIWVAEDQEVGYKSGNFGDNSGVDGNGNVAAAMTFLQEGEVGSEILVKDGDAVTLTSTLAGTSTTTVSSNDVYTVVAWFEGKNVTNAYAGQSATFAINFEFVSD